MRPTCLLLSTLLLLASPLAAERPGTAPDADAPPVNWAAPPYWLPGTSPMAGATDEIRAVPGAPVPGNGAVPGAPEGPAAVPSGALPFYAIAPCRVMDTRDGSFPSGYGPPRLTAAVSRDVVMAGRCGIPLSAEAVSVNFAVTSTDGPGFLSAWPAGSPMPTVASLNYVAGQTIANAAVVPLGPGGAMSVIAGVSGTELIVDVNGYYAPQSVVTSISSGASTLAGPVTLAPGTNVTITPSGQTLTIAAAGGGSGVTSISSGASTLTGAVTLAPGSNVTITPSGQTLTFAASGGGSLPSGTSGQTLRHDGTSWVASGVLANDGTTVATTGNLTVGGNLGLPSTSGAGGQVLVNGTRFIHEYGVGNTFTGANAGNLTTTGGLDTGFGEWVLNAVTTGDRNTGVGFGALVGLTTGSQNTVVGAWALQGPGTVGGSTSDNVAIGFSALKNNSAASRNTAIGSLALQALSYSNGGVSWNTENTAVGYNALVATQPTTTANGYQNTGVGANALAWNTTGSMNVALGHGALFTNTVADENVGLGAGALRDNLTASRNTAVGSSALMFQAYTNGGVSWNSENTAVGYQALYVNQPTTTTNGFQNTAVGAFSLAANSTGSFNVAVGHGALFTASTSESNVAVGRGALHYATGHHNVAVGDLTSELNTIGSWNVALGAGALHDNQTGAGNVAIGYQAGYTETASNRLYIGNSLGTLIYGRFDTGRVAIGATDPLVALDVNGRIRSRTITSTTGTNTVCCDDFGVFGLCSSDSRLKKDVVDLPAEIDIPVALSRLRGVAFSWDTTQERARNLGEKREIGFLAQEVEAVLPHVVTTAPDGYKSMDYPKLTAILVEALKAQQQRLETLEKRLAELERARLDVRLR